MADSFAKSFVSYRGRKIKKFLQTDRSAFGGTHRSQYGSAQPPTCTT